MMLAAKLFAVSALAIFLAIRSTADASLLYLYDFPGNSGLAVDQTNSQPSGATFSDFTRTNVGTPPTGPSDSFRTNNWSLATSLDSTKFVSFSIVASGGFHLDLSSLTFSAQRFAQGPQSAEVALFINGSSIAYATFGFSPTTTMTSYTFNFTPLTDADNVTFASFRFYGWNATGTGGQLYLDDVATNGTISSLPEVAPVIPVSLIILCSVVEIHRRRARDFRVRNRRSRGLGPIGPR